MQCNGCEVVYVPGGYRNPDTSINPLSMEQYDEDYIKKCWFWDKTTNQEWEVNK